MKKKAANTKAPARRPPPSKAARERVRRHLAGERPLSLDPAEAAGAAFISLEERARARFARQKQEKEAEAARLVYSPKRKAEFLIANAVDAGDRKRAEEEVRKLGLDPRKIKPRKSSKR